MIKFEVGKKYEVHSICNWDCVWIYEVVKRTACTVTLKDKNGEEKRFRISKAYSGKSEAVLPLGRYSMCPVLTADNVSF